jgi:hypothetical protein
MKRVTVTQFGGTIAEKIVVEDRGDILLLTTEDEWEASKAENRPPISVGFRREYIVDKSPPNP